MKLKDYDVKPGDMCKIPNSSGEVGWSELKLIRVGNFAYPYLFLDGNYSHDDRLCEAVLRPSIIIRDSLDAFLRYLSSPDYSPERGSCPCQPDITFQIIRPRKEEANSAEIEQALKDLADLYSKAEEMLKKVDELEKKLLVLDSK